VSEPRTSDERCPRCGATKDRCTGHAWAEPGTKPTVSSKECGHGQGNPRNCPECHPELFPSVENTAIGGSAMSNMITGTNNASLRIDSLEERLRVK
jgi:hypothetical protein